MKKPTSGTGDKNPAAVAHGKLRAATMTTEERQTAGRAGGAARAKNLTKAQRKAIASAAAKARWDKAAPDGKRALIIYGSQTVRQGVYPSRMRTAQLLA